MNTQLGLDLGKYRIDEHGRIVRNPLANPFALRISPATDLVIAERFINHSQRLKVLVKLSKSDEADCEAINIEVANLFTKLKNMSSQLELVTVERFTQADDLEDEHFFCDCCFLPLHWKNGPRNRKGLAEVEQQQRLEALSDQQLNQLVDMSKRELDYIAGFDLDPQKKGRNYFSHGPGYREFHDQGPSAVLAIDILDFMKHIVDRQNGPLVDKKKQWSLKVLDTTRLTQIHIQLRQGKYKPVDFLIVPFGKPICPEGSDPILISAEERKGNYRRLTIRGLTRARPDVALAHERFKKGSSDAIYIQDFYQRDGSKQGRATFRRQPIELEQAIVGIVSRKLKFVENIHEIDQLTFKYVPRFGLFNTERQRGYEKSDFNAASKAVWLDRYYADRRRILDTLKGNIPGMSVEFDDRQDWKPRFGRATLIFFPPRTGLTTTVIWSPKDGVRKTVVNPDISMFYKSRDVVPQKREFRVEDWKDTLVVFHSRDKVDAAAQRREFGMWLHRVNILRVHDGLAAIEVKTPSFREWVQRTNEDRKQRGLSEVNVVDIGLQVFHHTNISRVREKFNSFMLPQELLEQISCDEQNAETIDAAPRKAVQVEQPTLFPGEAELGSRTKHVGEVIDQISRQFRPPKFDR